MPSGNHVVHGVAHEAVKSGSRGSTRRGSTVVSREMRKNIRGGGGERCTWAGVGQDSWADLVRQLGPRGVSTQEQIKI
jgi:hypothetical protein